MLHPFTARTYLEVPTAECVQPDQADENPSVVQFWSAGLGAGQWVNFTALHKVCMMHRSFS